MRGIRSDVHVEADRSCSQTIQHRLRQRERQVSARSATLRPEDARSRQAWQLPQEDKLVVPGAGHAGCPGLQEAIRVRGGAEDQAVHTNIPPLHEDMGRGGPEGVYAIVEAQTRQER